TTKIWNSNHTYDLTISSFEESLKKLQTDYVDLLLIHWPNPIAYRDDWETANAETWRAMEMLYKAGKVRAIGVSNFRVRHLETLKKTATVQPMVNQLFLAPGELELNSKTAMIKTADAPAETAVASGIIPSELIFQMCTANVSAGRNGFNGLAMYIGFQLVKSSDGALCPAV
ncbi:aldo/keto reductase, partial [Clostridioides difficile]|uniref:aldo/keto reductase n=1 Tax=Clostridioides difficile TaxID=1496 RepID=UPI003A8E33A0